MKCPKCKKKIRRKEKSMVCISFYKQMEIDLQTGYCVGGDNITEMIYHRKCFDFMMAPRELKKRDIRLLWREFYKENKKYIHGLWSSDVISKKFCLFVGKKGKYRGKHL